MYMFVVASNDSSYIINYKKQIYSLNNFFMCLFTVKPLVVQIQVPNFVSSSSSSSLLSSNRSGSGTLPLSSSSSSLSASTQSSNSRLLVVSAGRKTNIECRSWGSRPPAEITWWRGSRRLPTAASRSHYTDSQESESSPISGNDATNLTISILSYTAASEDDGQRLTCRADNLQLSNEELEDSVIISVRCMYKLIFYIFPFFNCKLIHFNNSVHVCILIVARCCAIVMVDILDCWLSI